MTTSTSKTMYIVSIVLFCTAILELIAFFILRDSDALFATFISVSGGVFILTYRSKVWNKRKVFELKPNAFFFGIILFLIVLEFLFLYSFIYYIPNNWFFQITFFVKWGEYLAILIPGWIITLIYNLKK